MKEDQHTEWKESWRDEYLQWICAFANSSGGTLTIGKTDDGSIKGIDNAKKLSEDLPNKILNKLGIIADVNLHTTNQRDYIEIKVQPYPNPISYDGRYYVRTGSTKQTLNGESLTRFLLAKTSDSWESTPMTNVDLSEYDARSFELFKQQAKNAKRVDIPENKEPLEILERFSLINNGKINRAGYLLFYPNPERLFIGAFIKIGYFMSETDILFQDVVEGSLIQQIDKTLELLHTKYIIKTIEFRGALGVNVFPFAERALREAIINACAHRDFSKGNPIQIRVYKDEIRIFNEGGIPVDWTKEKFFGPHSSKPRNAAIANVLYSAGLIERWGLGIKTIMDENNKLNIPPPEFSFGFDDFTITLFGIQDVKKRNERYNPSQPIKNPSSLNEALSEAELQKFKEVSIKLKQKSLDIITRMNSIPMNRTEVLELVALKNETFNFKSYILPLIDAKVIDYAFKDRKNNSHQQYFLTEKGLRYKNYLLMLLEHLKTSKKLNN